MKLRSEIDYATGFVLLGDHGHIQHGFNNEVLRRVRIVLTSEGQTWLNRNDRETFQGISRKPPPTGSS